ncbi:MAG: type II toxin-antitoxin system VapC family toxin [Chloroflexi bacterium]|nr:type II toxin-antitoxin system VapC family toxin [Chloroflexota bacterium]
MTGRYLLDTNIVIALFTDEQRVKQRLETDGEIFIASTVIGELCFGARKSERVEENLARVAQFAAHNVVLDCDADSGFRYGEIKNALRLKGRPIPENDVWLAAVALQHDLTLVTRDAHFDVIDGLITEAW